MNEGGLLKSFQVFTPAVTLFNLENCTDSRFLSLFEREEVVRLVLGASLDGNETRAICPEVMWVKKDDELHRVRDEHKLKVKEELKHKEEKQICLRPYNMGEEVPVSGNKDLYEILKLNMKEVCGKSFEEQNDMIKKAYHSQLRRWHPDKNTDNGDNAKCQEIIIAYKILKDPGIRAVYNNVADHDTGWLSNPRWKAAFNPECYSDEKNKQYRKRTRVILFLTLLAMGGVPSEAKKEGLAGIAVSLGGTAKLAFKVAQYSLERQIILRMENKDVFRCFINSLTNKLDIIHAGGPKTTWKHFLVYILLDALLAGIAGVPGRLTENIVEGVVSVEEALAAFESFSSDPRNSVEELTTVAAQTFTTAVEKRVRYDVENKSIEDHIKYSANEAATAVGKYSAKAGAKVAEMGNDRATEMKEKSSIQNNTTNGECNEETNDENISNLTLVAQNLKDTAAKDKSKPTTQDDCVETRYDIGKDEKSSTLNYFGQKYISKGLWFSKMHVDYYVNGEKIHCESHGGRSSILIPNNATNIEVRFQVLRGPGIWCDVKEYDRHKNEWKTPTRPHIFKYDKPVSCMYTLAGNLYYEAVIDVTEDYSNEDINDLPSFEDLIAETNDESWRLVEHRLKLFSEGLQFLKMLVDYKVNGEGRHDEVKGSGSSILIPYNATNIEVKFQVFRYIGIWSDVKKYDPSKRCLIEPIQAHIFEYDTPVSRTYTLTRGWKNEDVVITEENDGENDNKAVRRQEYISIDEFDTSQNTKEVSGYMSTAAKTNSNLSTRQIPWGHSEFITKTHDDKDANEPTGNKDRTQDIQSDHALKNGQATIPRNKVMQESIQNISDEIASAGPVKDSDDSPGFNVDMERSKEELAGKPVNLTPGKRQDKSGARRFFAYIWLHLFLPIIEKCKQFIRYFTKQDDGDSRQKWFEKNVFDENFTVKDEHMKKLASLPWVSDFHVGVTSKPEKSWQIFITYTHDKVPSIADLERIFGVEIASFVDFIQGSNKPVPPPRFLRGSRSGDKICTGKTDEGDGTISIITADRNEHYPITCYHSCFNVNDPCEDLTMAKLHEKLIDDHDHENSTGCQGVIRVYDTENLEQGQLPFHRNPRLAQFYIGLYDDNNDIALVKLNASENCIDAVNFLRNENINLQLASNEKVARMLWNNGGRLNVEKLGAITGSTRGELYTVDGRPLFGTEMKMCYRINGTHGQVFAKRGDSGSLLYIIDSENRKIPFGYLCSEIPQDDNSAVYGGRNLKYSIDQLKSRKNLSDLQPCGMNNNDTEQYERVICWMLVILVIFVCFGYYIKIPISITNTIIIAAITIVITVVFKNY